MCQEKLKTCEDCEGEFKVIDGRPYKYEPDIWLCDDCHDQRMEDSETDDD